MKVGEFYETDELLNTTITELEIQNMGISVYRLVK